MEYSENDLQNLYDGTNSINTNEPVVWNSHTVYFDDELVEYQGRYYVALCKTSAEVPGRCKAGIWKEVIYEEPESSVDEQGYEDIYDEALIPQPEAPVKKPVKPALKKEAPASVTPKPVNKPLAKKKTLKEQAQEKQALSSQKSVQTPKPQAVQQAMPTRKMQMAPSEQSIVNAILKEMDFKKIKGFNTDDNNICKNLILPQSQGEASLEWNSSHADIISAQGEVKRPIDGHDVAVNLSLTVKLNKTSATRFYTLWVKAEEKVLSDKECVDLVYEALDFDYIKGANQKASVITNDLELLSHGLYDTEIFWASKNRAILDETGRFHKAHLKKNSKLRLYAIITKGNEERLKHFDLILKV